MILAINLRGEQKDIQLAAIKPMRPNTFSLRSAFSKVLSVVFVVCNSARPAHIPSKNRRMNMMPAGPGYNPRLKGKWCGVTYAIIYRGFAMLGDQITGTDKIELPKLERS